MPPAVEGQSLNHWTTREVPTGITLGHETGALLQGFSGFLFHFLLVFVNSLYSKNKMKGIRYAHIVCIFTHTLFSRRSQCREVMCH